MRSVLALYILLCILCLTSLANCQTIHKTPVVDKKFIFANGILVGSSIADMWVVKDCIDTGTCREANPLLSGSKMLPVESAITVSEVFVSYELKKHNQIWWIVPVAGTSWHLAGIGIGLTF